MQMSIRKSFLAIVSVTALLLAPTTSFPAQTTEVAAASAIFVPHRVSTAADGTQGDNAGVGADRGSIWPSVSADGRFVAFSSASSNLVPNDTNSVRDVFVKDRQTGAIVRASTAADGTQADDASQGGFFGNIEPSISADGRYVAFVGYSSNLVPNDTNGYPDIFVKDVQTGAISRANTFGGLQANDRSFRPQISANGRYVVFETGANNLRGFDPNGNPIDTNFSFDVFRKDLQTGALELVSFSPTTFNGVANSQSTNPTISADGRFVAYVSSASNIAPNDTNGNNDVIVTDMDGPSHRIASIKSDGTQGQLVGTGLAAAKHTCNISADGRFVAFHSTAAFTPDDTNNGFADVYLRDMQANTTTLISKNPATGAVGAANSSFDGTVSADGRFVAFVSLTGNLLPQPHNNGNFSVYVLDRQLNTLREVPYIFLGSGGWLPEISDDGNFVVFNTDFNTLAANDTNNTYDIFAADLRLNAGSVNSASFTPDGGNDSIAVSAQDSWTATSNAPWITVTSGGSGTGNGTITYTVMPNPGSAARNGTIRINGSGGQVFTVLQAGSFNDVPPSHPFYTEISKLYARGVTVGCGGGNYCPDQPVTREQMAAFIIRALGSFNPPPPAQQRFADVPPENPFYAFIEQMAVRQITLGCGGGNYCPAQPVLREQMAAFMIRALHPPGYVPPPPPSQRFLDVPPSSLFYAHIEEMAVRQITAGCSASPPLYCPASQVTRAQMAAFLVRAFGL